MPSFEQLFNSSIPDVVVPDASLDFPSSALADDWLQRLKTGAPERNQVFFDEKLRFLLTIHIDPNDKDASINPDLPPPEILSFLSHIQVSLDATYISQVQPESPDTPKTPFLRAPPRTASIQGAKPRANSPHPSIFAPSTPNPTPSTKENDRRYIKSEGTLLLSTIWGQNQSDDSLEAFSLIRSEKDNVWVAVYRLIVSVSFLRLNFADPLLCLTVSATLREKPLATSQSKNPLASYLSAKGALPNASVPPSPIHTDHTSEDDHTEQDESIGLEEVNLLQGLSTGPTFVSTGLDRVYLPSTRLGNTARRQILALSSPDPSTTSQQNTTIAASRRPSIKPHPVLRKSFRKTLHTVSGFKVRMRTVFVPYVLSKAEMQSDEWEQTEAGNEERSVVLCVEVENTGESGPLVGFMVEGADVSVGGEGATATLIGRGDVGEEDGKEFPLFIGSMEQYNLLYAVSFLRSPADADGLSLANASHTPEKSAADMKRMVVINIHLRPFTFTSPEVDNIDHQNLNPDDLSFPAHTFSSRWSCVLDLASSQANNVPEINDSHHNDALPEPASPFPIPTTPHTSSPALTDEKTPRPPSPAIAGNKRHTLPTHLVAGRAIQSALSPRNIRASWMGASPTPGQDHRPSVPSRLSSYGTYAAQEPTKTPTTYAPPPEIQIPGPNYGYDTTSTPSNESPDHLSFQVPPTPAYPAYPPNTAFPSTPHSQVPVAIQQQAGMVMPSVDIRRDRRMGIDGNAMSPQTPGPLLASGFRGGLGGDGGEDGGEPIVVSVGLLPVDGKTRTGGRIYPLDTFTLDIFVFNKSSWTRRFEVSVPDTRRQKRLEERAREYYVPVGQGKKDGTGVGVLSLDNRVRIGPLRPSTCQSVRMEFLALTHGVHTIDTLTLLDVESGFSMNLRSVMDIVVHDSNQ